MADLSLSLDDLIRKGYGSASKAGKRNNKQIVLSKAKNIAQPNPTNRKLNVKMKSIQRVGIKSRLGLHQPIKNKNVAQAARLNLRLPTPVPVQGDARSRIIQKNRLKLVDARDKLNMLARKTDARSKLQAKRQRMGGFINQGLTKSFPQQQQRPGVWLVPNNTELMRTTGINRTVGNNLVTGGKSLKNRLTLQTTSSLPAKPAGFIITTTNEKARSQPQPIRLLRKIPQPEPVYQFDNYMDVEEIEPSPPSKFARLPNPTKSGLRGDLLNRLDGTEDPVISPLQGYKVNVSNLQPSVTVDDILELFSDIGSLRRANMVGPGRAEVVYREYKDASTAVETYHNRQLDGQPMQCKLITKGFGVEQSTNSASILSSRILGSQSGFRSDVMQSKPISGRPIPVLSSSRGATGSGIAPDITAIHKALFAKDTGSKLTNRPAFTVTMKKPAGFHIL